MQFHLKNRLRIPILTWVLFFSLLSTTHASINQHINYQGKLVDASGTLVTDGTYDMVFRMYDAPSGGTLLWTGNYTSGNGNPVSVTQGLFSILLGSGTGNAFAIDFTNGTYYFGMSVNGDPEMTPRKEIGSVPQAFNANNVVGNGLINISGTINGLTVTSGTITSGTWNGSVITPNSGGTGIDTSASTGVAVVTAGSWNVASTLGIALGGTGSGAVGGAGAIAYSNGTAYQFTAAGTSGQCLQSTGAGTPTWGSCLSSIAPDSLDFTELADTMTLDASTDIAVTGSNVFSVTNTGSGNSFVVNDQVGDATPFLIDPSGNVGVGVAAPTVPLDVAGNINTSTVYQIGGNTALSVNGTSNLFTGVSAGPNNTTGQYNTFVGTGAGLLNTSGAQNVFIGSGSGEQNTVALNNVFIGLYAGRQNTASQNTFVGSVAGNANTTGTSNAFFGYSAGTANTTGSANTFLGYLTGYNNSTASANTFVGRGAGMSTTTGGSNAFFGSQSGLLNTTGSSNVFVGNNAGNASTTGSNNIVLGHSIDTQSATGNNQLTIGNVIFGTGGFGTGTTVGTGNIGIGIATPGTKLDVNGQISVPNGNNLTPSYTFEGNLDTGMFAAYFGAPLAFTTDGNVRQAMNTSDIRVGNDLNTLDLGTESKFIIEGSENSPSTGFSFASLGFSNDSNQAGQTSAEIAKILVTSQDATVNQGRMEFQTKDGTALATRMMIDKNGFVGVGITPSAVDKMEIAGDLRVGTGTTGCVKDADGAILTGTCSSDERFKKIYNQWNPYSRDYQS